MKGGFLTLLRNMSQAKLLNYGKLMRKVAAMVSAMVSAMTQETLLKSFWGRFLQGSPRRSPCIPWSKSMLKIYLEAYHDAQDKCIRDCTNFLTGSKPTGKSKPRRGRTSQTPIRPSNSIQTHPNRQITPPKRAPILWPLSTQWATETGRVAFCGRQRARARLCSLSFSLNFSRVWYNGLQARQSLLPLTGLLEGVTAITKLVEAARIPKNRQAVIYKTSSLADLPARASLHSSPINFTYRHLTRSNKQTFLFCHTRRYPAAAKFKNTHWPLSTSPAVTKKLSLWPRKTLLRLRKLFSWFPGAALWLGQRCCRLTLAASSWEK